MSEPIDHIADKSGTTIELLQALTDDELAEQGAYWRAKLTHYRSLPNVEGASMYKQPSYAAYRVGNWVGYVGAEQEARRRGEHALSADQMRQRQG
jgi:hypothetical protein